MTDHSIAGRTKKSAHFPGCVVVVNIERSWFGFRSSADGTLPALAVQKRIVIRKGYSVFPNQVPFPLSVTISPISSLAAIWVAKLPFLSVFQVAGLAPSRNSALLASVWIKL
jgi:hypothetical protein